MRAIIEITSKCGGRFSRVTVSALTSSSPARETKRRLPGCFVFAGGLGLPGARVEIVDGPDAGRFDIIAAGMYVTPERCRQVAFSEPTYAVGEGFVVEVVGRAQIEAEA